MKRVGIFSRIYRNEKNVIRAIESILNQTYLNITYYILVNNATISLVEKYAEQDKRIKIKQVEDPTLGIGFLTYMNEIASENDFVGTLDVDDWYDEDFVEKMVLFSEMYNLEVVGCGSVFESENEEEIAYRKLENTIIWDETDFPKVFPNIFQFFRPLWGKLYASRLFIGGIENKVPSVESRGGYAGDTILSLLIAKNAKKLGIINLVKHHYTVSESNSSNKILEGRFKADAILHKFLMEYLADFGPLSAGNIEFMYLVYGYGLNDTLILAFKNYHGIFEIKKIFKTMFDNFETREYFVKYDKIGLRKKLCSELFIKNLSYVKKHKSDFYDVFTLIFPELEVKLTEKEFEFCLEQELLVLLTEKKFEELFIEKISRLSIVDKDSEELVVFLKKITKDDILLKILSTKESIHFILKNKVLIEYIFLKKYIEVKEYIKLKLENQNLKELEREIELLLEVYLIVCALTDDEHCFIEGKAMQANWYRKTNQIENFAIIIQELKTMGIELTF